VVRQVVDQLADHQTVVELGRHGDVTSACRRQRYIGLCYGPPGVSKTLSARAHAHWDEVSHRLTRWMANLTQGKNHPEWHALVYTPTVNATPSVIGNDLRELSERLAGIRSETLRDPRVRSDPHRSSRLSNS
jgi:DNA transposition AAA+ family ATPase